MRGETHTYSAHFHPLLAGVPRNPRVLPRPQFLAFPVLSTHTALPTFPAFSAPPRPALPGRTALSASPRSALPRKPTPSASPRTRSVPLLADEIDALPLRNLRFPCPHGRPPHVVLSPGSPRRGIGIPQEGETRQSALHVDKGAGSSLSLELFDQLRCILASVCHPMGEAIVACRTQEESRASPVGSRVPGAHPMTSDLQHDAPPLSRAFRSFPFRFPYRQLPPRKSLLQGGGHLSTVGALRTAFSTGKVAQMFATRAHRKRPRMAS